MQETGLLQTMWSFVLSSRIIQFLALYFKKYNPEGWVYIRRNDPRFIQPVLWGNPGRVGYVGDRNKPPTRWWTNRNTWTTWEVVQLSENSPAAYLGFDVFNGRRLVRLGSLVQPGTMVAFRVGHEDGSVFFIAPKSDFVGGLPATLHVARIYSETDLSEKYPNVLRV